MSTETGVGAVGSRARFDSAGSGALMIVGATSGAGKSTVVAGLCRLLAANGREVAPFKAQNMSNHSTATCDGGEIGVAQSLQAAAARTRPDRRMGPVLLQPAPEGSHVVVMGAEVAVVGAGGFGTMVDLLRSTVLEAFVSLRRDHDLVIAEGAGGAAEINLFDHDIVNLPLAAASGIRAVVVVDIDRGGAFAAAHGTIDLLPPPLRRTVAGVIFNRFRGDRNQLCAGIRTLEERTGVPVLGVLADLATFPGGDRPLFGLEDGLDVGRDAAAIGSDRPVRVAAIRLPHLANPADLDPFLIEPDVDLRWAQHPSQVVDADLIVIPGSRATVADLAWLAQQGFAAAIGRAATSSNVRIIGLCAGYQMLGSTIEDGVESEGAAVQGLGLLDTTTTLRPPKIVRRSQGAVGAEPVAGFQIRFGRMGRSVRPWLTVDGAPEGAIDASGRVSGTSLHGLFDADGFRQSLLAAVASSRGRSYRPGPIPYVDALDQQHDRLARWLSAGCDIDRLVSIASAAGPVGREPGW